MESFGRSFAAHDRDRTLWAGHFDPAMTVPEAFQGLVNHSPDAVVITTEDGRITFASPSALALFGYEALELLGKSIECLVPEAARGLHAQHRAAYRAAPAMRPMGIGLALMARHRDGHGIPVEVSLRPEPTPSGVWVAAVVRDLRSVQLLEGALEASDAELRAIVDHASEFLALLTPSGTLQRANPSPPRVLDAAPDVVLGRPFWDTPWFTTLPDTQARVRRAVAMAASGAPARIEVEQRRRDGSPGVFDLTVTPIHDATGRVGLLLAESRDVSDRKAAERALGDAHRRMALAVRGTHDGIWDWRCDTGECYFSPRWKTLLGYDERELPDHEASFFSRVHPDDLPIVRAAISRHLEAREVYDIEARLRHRSGEFRWYRCRGQAEWDDTGRPIRMAGSMSDVTDQRKDKAEIVAVSAMLAERVSERTAALQQRTQQLSQLAADLTLAEQHAREQLAKALHDGLQQMLFSARLRLDRVLLRADAGQSDQAALLAELRHDLDEATTAARSLAMELFPPALQNRSLPEALAWLADWKRQKYGLMVSLTSDADATPDRRDVRILLFESVRELLFNAVKHAGVNEVRVDLARGADDTLRISVEDAGVGFDPATLANADGPHRATGLGLLSIRERLVLLGGRLDIEASPGRGARFLLVAPRRGTAPHWPSEPPAVEAEPGGPPVRAPRGTRRPIRVLIADDHPVVRTGLREMLQDRAEFVVVGEAGDGQEAIAQARTLRPDAIVMDISMPRLDGIEATRLIHLEMPSIRIFGLSTQDSTVSPHPIEEAGAVGYFTKGADTQRLIDRMLAVRPALPAADPRDR